MVSAPAFSHLTSISNVASQGVSTLPTSSSSLISQEANIANDSVQEHGHIINPVQQPIRPGGHGSLLGNRSQVRLMSSILLERSTSMGQPNTETRPIQAHMSNIISSGVTSTPSVTSIMSVSGQSIGTQQMVQSTALGRFGSNSSTASGNSNIAAASSQRDSMGQQAGINSLGVYNDSAMNVPIGQHSNALQPPPNYVNIWEVPQKVLKISHKKGTLARQRQGQPAFFSKLEQLQQMQHQQQQMHKMQQQQQLRHQQKQQEQQMQHQQQQMREEKLEQLQLEQQLNYQQRLLMQQMCHPQQHIQQMLQQQVQHQQIQQRQMKKVQQQMQQLQHPQQHMQQMQPQQQSPTQMMSTESNTDDNVWENLIIGSWQDIWRGFLP
ncbi:unnamed protein product [Urochloa humidicola]